VPDDAAALDLLVTPGIDARQEVVLVGDADGDAVRDLGAGPADSLRRGAHRPRRSRARDRRGAERPHLASSC
jgi:hypothetical protein